VALTGRNGGKMHTNDLACIACGSCPEPGHRLAVSLPEGRNGVVCDHHDPTVPGFRDDIFYRLFRFHGLPIGDDRSARVLSVAADLIAAQLMAAATGNGPRTRPDRQLYGAPAKVPPQQSTRRAAKGVTGPGRSGQGGRRGGDRWASGT